MLLIFMGHQVKKETPVDAISLLKEKTKKEVIILAKSKGVTMDKENMSKEVDRYIDKIISPRAD